MCTVTKEYVRDNQIFTLVNSALSACKLMEQEGRGRRRGVERCELRDGRGRMGGDGWEERDRGER